MDYFVTWSIDINADTPKAAALQAFEIMQRPGTSANVFDVSDGSNMTRVDLEELGALPRVQLQAQPMRVEPYQATHGADLCLVDPYTGHIAAIIPHNPHIQTAEYLDGDNVIRMPLEIARARAMAAGPLLLAVLCEAADLAESALEAIWGDDEPDPDCRHIAGLAMMRAAIRTATAPGVTSGALPPTASAAELFAWAVGMADEAIRAREVEDDEREPEEPGVMAMHRQSLAQCEKLLASMNATRRALATAESAADD